MSTDHAYTWLVVLRDDSTHQIDADKLHFEEGFAVWVRDQTSAKYVVCAIPATQIHTIDIMSQMTGLRSQRTELEWGTNRNPANA